MCIAHGMPVCSRARDLRAQSAPGFPCALSSREGQRNCKTRAKPCRENARARFHVIASEATLLRLLRKLRWAGSPPKRFCAQAEAIQLPSERRPDCFIASLLAMTAEDAHCINPAA